jgi:hypothetical protein
LADLVIPKEHRSPLNKIRSIPEGSFPAFLSALEKSPDLIPAVPGVLPEAAEEITNVVKELYGVRTYFDMDVSEFVSALAESLQESEGTAFSVDEVPKFKERLTKLLTIDSVSITLKATSLRREYERRFCTARIMTDARPIYSEDPLRAPSAVLINHNLRISYHDDSPHLKEIYFAMDSDDVAGLREVLDRAEEKAKSLVSIFKAANLRIVD